LKLFTLFLYTNDPLIIATAALMVLIIASTTQ